MSLETTTSQSGPTGTVRPGAHGAVGRSGSGEVPRCSVVIPAYNAAGTLPDSLASVFAQTFTDYEIIVVDDGSTDSTAQILESYGDDLRVLRKPNEGRPAAARNRGVAQARGEYIAFLDADDLWRPEKLARQVELLDASPEVGLCFTAAAIIDEGGRELGINRCPSYARGRVYDLISTRNVMVGSSVMVRRSAIEQVGAFDEELTSIENWELWIRVAREWEVDFVDEPLTAYRKHRGNRSVNVELRRRNIFRILERHHDPEDRSPAARTRRREAYFNAYFTVLGIGYFGRLEMDKARAALWHAFRLKPRADVLRYLLLSLMGKRTFLAVRNLRRRLAGRTSEEEAS
jgi:glycosyltransferase involved in cell wall biosynthesis